MSSEVDLLSRLEVFHEYAIKTKNFHDASMYEECIHEIDYLRWFFANADFGPADDDVRQYLNKQYVEETGNEIPEGY